MLEFFMAMKPPTTTYQEKKLTVRNGKPHTYEPPNVCNTREKCCRKSVLITLPVKRKGAVKCRG